MQCIQFLACCVLAQLLGCWPLMVVASSADDAIERAKREHDVLPALRLAEYCVAGCSLVVTSLTLIAMRQLGQRKSCVCYHGPLDLPSFGKITRAEQGS